MQADDSAVWTLFTIPGQPVPCLHAAPRHWSLGLLSPPRSSLASSEIWLMEVTAGISEKEPVWLRHPFPQLPLWPCPSRRTGLLSLSFFLQMLLGPLSCAFEPRRDTEIRASRCGQLSSAAWSSVSFPQIFAHLCKSSVPFSSRYCSACASLPFLLGP